MTVCDRISALGKMTRTIDMAAHTPAITRPDLGRRILTKGFSSRSDYGMQRWLLPELKNRDPVNPHSCKLEDKLARARVVSHSTAIRGSQVCGLPSILSAAPDDGC